MVQDELVPYYTPAQFLNLAFQVRDSNQPNALGCKFELHSHLNILALEELLMGYSDPWPVLGLK